MAKRLTVIPWKCDESGDCCRYPNAVTMSVEEAAVLRQNVSADVWATLVWQPQAPSPHGTLIKLQAGPCPLLSADNKCTVYAVRPFTCRRFACLRPNAKDEPFEPDHEKFGCANVRERVESDRDARRFMERLQSKAQRWAVNHGWRIA